jgi:hypothetical protein
MRVTDWPTFFLLLRSQNPRPGASEDFKEAALLRVQVRWKHDPNFRIQITTLLLLSQQMHALSSQLEGFPVARSFWETQQELASIWCRNLGLASGHGNGEGHLYLCLQRRPFSFELQIWQ